MKKQSRVKSTLHKGPEKIQNEIPKISAEFLQVASSIGKFIEYWGFKSIHGKIWALLYLSARQLSAVELARYLGVSKTLLSFSTSELIAFQVIQEVGRGPKRTIYYQANPEIASVICNVLRSREHPIMAEIQSSLDRLQSTEKRRSSARIKKPRRDLEVDPNQLGFVSELVTSAMNILDSLQWGSLSPDTLAMQFLMISAALGSQGEVRQETTRDTAGGK
jgi:hypothetical protein